MNQAQVPGEAAQARNFREALAAKRVLIVLAHPDDEVLGCGALLGGLSNPVLVHVTDGAPRDGVDARRLGFSDAAAYAGARRGEALEALALCGISAERCVALGMADQEAAHRLAPLSRELLGFVADADVVLTHAFEGGHPDHDAVAFAVAAAVRLIPQAADRPCVIEMPFYHAAPEGWARQSFLPQPGAGPEITLRMSPEERALKRAMAHAHASQADVLGGFSLEVERYRPAPAYDFAVLPNGGALLYERHGWNLDGARWIHHVGAALASLGLQGAP